MPRAAGSPEPAVPRHPRVSVCVPAGPKLLQEKRMHPLATGGMAPILLHELLQCCGDRKSTRGGVVLGIPHGAVLHERAE